MLLPLPRQVVSPARRRVKLGDFTKDVLVQLRTL